MIDRRHFTLSAAAAAALSSAGHALAQQAAFVAGRDFVRLATPVATPPGGRIDVLEFFWYGCPHCNTFLPLVDAWKARQPADVALRRVPVGFSALHETHARLFYALEAIGEVERLHRRIFTAIHVQRRRLDREADMAAFVTEQGVDAARFTQAFRSFTVVTRARQARALADAYKVDGTPSIGVHGRYFTSGSLAGSHERALQVTSFLVERVRRGGPG